MAGGRKESLRDPGPTQRRNDSLRRNEGHGEGHQTRHTAVELHQHRESLQQERPPEQLEVAKLGAVINEEAGRGDPTSTMLWSPSRINGAKHTMEERSEANNESEDGSEDQTDENKLQGLRETGADLNCKSWACTSKLGWAVQSS